MQAEKDARQMLRDILNADAAQALWLAAELLEGRTARRPELQPMALAEYAITRMKEADEHTLALVSIAVAEQEEEAERV